MKGSKFALCVACCAAALSAGSAFAKAGERGPRINFEQFDANGDGQITREEAEKFRTDRFAAIDTDGDGYLTLEELTAEATTRAAQRAEKMMERMDADGDGRLTEQDLAQSPRAGRMFDRLDQNDDGIVTKAEFDDAQKHAGKRWGKKDRSE